MNGNPDTARVLQDAAEWLMALPEPSHMQLAAAGELLLEARSPRPGHTRRDDHRGAERARRTVAPAASRPA